MFEKVTFLVLKFQIVEVQNMMEVEPMNHTSPMMNKDKNLYQAAGGSYDIDAIGT